MRTLNYFLTVVIFVTIGLMYSCSKDNSLNESKSTNTQAEERSCTNGFSAAEITYIGTEHNTVVRNVLNNFDFKASDYQSELRQQVSIAYPKLSEISINNTMIFAENAQSFSINGSNNAGQLNNALLVNQYYTNLVNIINSFQTISDFENSLNSLKIIVDQNLTCSDRDFMLVSIEVAKNSLTLWAPKSIGGQGLYDEIQSKAGLSGGTADRWSGWRAVGAADLSGAATGFFEYGFGLAVPGGNAAVAGAIAWNAGMSSAFAAIL